MARKGLIAAWNRLWNAFARSDAHAQEGQTSKPSNRGAATSFDVHQLAGQSPPGSSPIPRLIGPYRIERHLGSNWVGPVYLARDGADQLIALWLLNENIQSDDARERFKREAQAVGRLRHHNIVRVIEVSQDANQAYIAMEYVDGCTLSVVIREKRQVDLDTKLRWIEELCAGLAHAHEQGVVHGGINPANIIIGETDTPKITDFGHTRVLTPADLALGRFLFNLNYQSPEAMTNHPTDHRCDIFAIGAVFYELLAHQPAFTGTKIDLRIIHESPRPLVYVVPGIDRQIVWIAAKALAKDPAKRYQSADEMRADIAAVRLGQAIPPVDESIAGDPWRPEGPSVAVGASGLINQTIGRYKILKRLGEGGMGSVYLARDPAIDRLIAIKFIREGAQFESDELRQRFMREAKVAGRLQHQNIVMVLDVGQHNGRPYIAMEYVEGFTLGYYIREKHDVSLDTKLKWIDDLCAGLAYAHTQNIIHRDVKPSNMMIDKHGALKILDFGIGRMGAHPAGTPTLMGTLSYMSPEQMTGRPVDHRSDIFAVGAVCYEILSHQRAFPGDIQDGVLHRVIHEPPKPLEQLVPGIDPVIVRIVDKALAKEAAKRYQTLDELRADIANFRWRPTDAGLFGPLAAGNAVGPYEIDLLIGKGGMAEVYRARDTRLGRDVALKVLPASFATDPDRLRRFEHEARATSALNHPNIVTVYDVGRAARGYYIAIELIDGQTLRQRLERAQLSAASALGIARQIADALSAAHATGVVHRDLKPENVMVRDDGLVKLLDFGLARQLAPAIDSVTAPALTVPGMMMGTLSYMAPEQITGGIVDARSDLFSFGVMLFEMITGIHPFKCDQPFETMSAIVHSEPRESSEPIPPAIANIIRRCVAKRPEDRYQSIGELAGRVKMTQNPRIGTAET